LLLSVGGTAVLFALFLFLFRAVTASGRLAMLAGAASSFAALAAAVGVVVLVIFVMIAARSGWRWLWLAWLMLSLIVVGWLAAFNFGDELAANVGETAVLGDITNTLEAWQDLPAIGRLGKLLDSESRTGKVRVLIWEGALKLISVHEPLQFPNGKVDRFNFLRPLIGYGPESMYVAYNRFYPPELATVEARNASPDRSHNETFDALVITGGLGFLIWQALYLSVFYFGFRWLGVVRTRRDRNLLIASWIVGAVLFALLITQRMGMPFLGVAIPFGSIMGLVVYLIYYALTAQAGGDDAAVSTEPFHVDRLLMTALVAAVLAHYVEIHFGIAIAATRTYFFVYVALMFLVGHRLPKMSETAVPEPTVKSRKQRRVREGHSWAPLLLVAFMMALMLGILGFEFMTYSLPPDKVVKTAADLPAAEIMYQSLFINARNGFVDSPFIFLMMMLTWVLGTAVALSEMLKNGEWQITGAAEKMKGGRRMTAAIVVGLIALGNIAIRIGALFAAPGGATDALGGSLALIWGGFWAWAAVRLILDLPGSRSLVGGLAFAGLLFSLPTLLAGSSGYALVSILVYLFIIYFLWDKSWSSSIVPIAVTAFLSLGIGLLYTYIQASLLRSSLLFQPPANVATIQELRVLEASQSTIFLTVFYIFTFALMFSSALVLLWPQLSKYKNSGSVPAYASLIVVFILAFVGINVSNMRIIQADVIYKRGKPFDDQATRNRDIESWQIATAIYEKAISLAPKEPGGADGFVGYGRKTTAPGPRHQSTQH
ncbi:MAG: O-antigen ligase family protein, partial [Anaerolineae bacterium]